MAQSYSCGPTISLCLWQVTISASGDVASLLSYPTGTITLSATSQKVQMAVDSKGLSSAGSYCGIISFTFACGSSAPAAQQCVSALVGSMVQQIASFSITGIQATTSVTLSKNANNALQIDAKLCIDVYSGLLLLCSPFSSIAHPHLYSVDVVSSAVPSNTKCRGT